MINDMVFVVKQKTAYEMRISDWSSDVCSSDLRARRDQRARRCGVAAGINWSGADVSRDLAASDRGLDRRRGRGNRRDRRIARGAPLQPSLSTSEDRRVGKECVRTFISRLSLYHLKHNTSLFFFFFFFFI